MVKKNYIQNEKLIELQDKYLKTKSQAVWEEFFLLSFQVCKNIVVSEFVKNNILFDQEKVNDNALNACIYVLRRYKNIGYQKKGAPENYRIDSNFITTFSYGVKHALYYCNKEQRNFNNAMNIDLLSNLPYEKIN